MTLREAAQAVVDTYEQLSGAKYQNWIIGAEYNHRRAIERLQSVLEENKVRRCEACFAPLYVIGSTEQCQNNHCRLVGEPQPLR